MGVNAYDTSSGGSAYLYRNLDTAGGALQEAAILSFSEATDYGGTSVALSGATALGGASGVTQTLFPFSLSFLLLLFPLLTVKPAPLPHFEGERRRSSSLKGNAVKHAASHPHPASGERESFCRA